LARARQRLLTSPAERLDAEYKAAVHFDGRSEFSLKLLRQIQGMANAGGGSIIIGFMEGASGLLEADPNHSEALAATYDPTTLSQQANSSVVRGQVLQLAVHYVALPATGLRHPVIEVRGFERTPYICRGDRQASDTGTLVLEQGAAYIRRPSAETSKVSTAQDWEELISRAVRARRDEFLGELRELLEQMGLTAAALRPSDAERLDDRVASERERAFREEDDGGW
jgi:hypothetical protein